LSSMKIYSISIFFNFKHFSCFTSSLWASDQVSRGYFYSVFQLHLSQPFHTFPEMGRWHNYINLLNTCLSIEEKLITEPTIYNIYSLLEYLIIKLRSFII
jgi:hypothetical protein